MPRGFAWLILLASACGRANSPSRGDVAPRLQGSVDGCWRHGHAVACDLRLTHRGPSEKLRLTGGGYDDTGRWHGCTMVVSERALPDVAFLNVAADREFPLTCVLHNVPLSATALRRLRIVDAEFSNVRIEPAQRPRKRE